MLKVYEIVSGKKDVKLVDSVSSNTEFYWECFLMIHQGIVDRCEFTSAVVINMTGWKYILLPCVITPVIVFLFFFFPITFFPCPFLSPPPHNFRTARLGASSPIEDSKVAQLEHISCIGNRF